MSFDEEKVSGNESVEPTNTARSSHEGVAKELVQFVKEKESSDPKSSEISEVHPDATGAVEAQRISDDIFWTIEATRLLAIKRMQGRDILVEAKVTSGASSLSSERDEQINLSAGAAIALVTGAEVAHQWKEFTDDAALQEFCLKTVERLAQKLEAVGLEYGKLNADPVWHAVFAGIAADELAGVETAAILQRGFHRDVLTSTGTFLVETFADHDEQIVEILGAMLLRLERLYHEINARPDIATHYPYHARAVVDDLKNRAQEILGAEEFSIEYPAGNVTCLIKVPRARLLDDRGALVAKATQLVTEGLVEQVGFFSETKNVDGTHEAMLQMSGGEFCLNGIISLAAHIYGKTMPRLENDIKVQCSGGTLPVLCECSFNNDNNVDVRAIFSVEPHMEAITGGMLVRLPGISHFVMERPFDGEGEDELKILMAAHADAIQGVPAVGLIRFQIDDSGVVICPTVYVGATDTCVDETACGSGTAALVFVMVQRARERQLSSSQWEIGQPSQSWVKAKYMEKGEFQTPAMIIKTTVRHVCGSSDEQQK